MSRQRKQALQGYAFGMCCTFLGAWLTHVTASMLPLALGSAAAIVFTVPLAKAIWSSRKSDSA